MLTENDRPSSRENEFRPPTPTAVPGGGHRVEPTAPVLPHQDWGMLRVDGDGNISIGYRSRKALLVETGLYPQQDIGRDYNLMWSLPI